MYGRGGAYQGGGAAAAAAASRTVEYWGVADNLAASTSTNLPFVLNNANHVRQPIAKACTLTRITAFLTVAAAGSDLLVRVGKNGAAADSTLTLTIPVGSTIATVEGTGITFAANDDIKLVAITDASWTATTADIQAYASVTE